MTDSPENPSPFAKNILLAMGHRELASDDFIAFRAAREELATKLADEFSGKGRMYGATPSEHKHAMDRLAFYYLVKLIFQQKLSLWYRNSQASGYASYASKALSEEAMREGKSSEYDSFIAKIGGIDKVKFDTLVGGVSIPDSEEKITIDAKAVYQFGRLKQERDKYWRFSLHDEFTPTGLADDPTTFQRIERISVSVTKQGRAGGKSSEHCINFTFRMAGNVCCPYAEYSEFSTPSLPVDSEFLEFGRTFIPENNTDEFYLHIEGLFYLFLTSHLLRLGKDSLVAEDAYEPPMLRLFTKAISEKRDATEKLFEARGYFQKNEFYSLTGNMFHDVLYAFGKKAMNNVKTTRTGNSGKKASCSDKSKIFKDALVAWLEASKKFTTEEEKLYFEIVQIYCDVKEKSAQRAIVRKFFPSEIAGINKGSKKEQRNAYRRLADRCIRKVDEFAERNNLPLVPKRWQRRPSDPV